MHSDRTTSRTSRRNAVLGWTATGVVALTAVERYLAGAYVWCGLALVVVLALAVPAIATGSTEAMVPWPLPVVAAVGVVLRALGVQPDLSGYLTIASIAIVVVFELVGYTDVELSRRFAVVFAAMTTLALQALWIVVQFYADQWLGTTFLESQVELQWDIVYVTVVSVVLAVAVELTLDHFAFAGGFDHRTSR